MTSTAPGPPGKTLRKIGLWLLALGALLGVAMTIGGLAWSFHAVGNADAADKATRLASGIGAAMYGPIVGAGVMAVGALFIVLALAKARPPSHRSNPAESPPA